MPAWLLSILLQVGVFIVQRYGVPYLESHYPYLAPLLDEIIAIIKGKGNSLPSQELRDCANGYCAVVGVPSDIKK